jgi:alpha-tubulin suppressor-like RCC1 family protein
VARPVLSRLWLIALVASGCYSIEYQPCKLRCGAGDSCPAELTCRADQFCHRPDESALCSDDLGVGDDLDGADFSGVDLAGSDLPPTARYRQLAVSREAAHQAHTCGIREDDSLWCWGSNVSGQLGTVGSPDHSGVAVPVGPAGVRWLTVSAGDGNNCGIQVAPGAQKGSLWCWGALIGQSAPQPLTQIGGFSDWKVIDVGQFHVCGIREESAATSSLWCWGLNDDGQLGDGTLMNRSAPVQAAVSSGVTQWTAVSTGHSHTCAIDAAKKVWCWGDDFYQQVGDGMVDGGAPPAGFPNTSRAPTAVLPGADRIGAGDFHSCAITAHLLSCWGDDRYGQSGGTGQRAWPMPVDSNLDWNELAVGDYRTLGVRAGGLLYAFGANDFGELGRGTFGGATQPAPISGSGWSAPATGEGHSCALQSGVASCWGKNSWGELGLGHAANQLLPVKTGGFVDWLKVSVAEAHACGIRGMTGGQGLGTLWCWGANPYGQLAPGGGPPSYTPRQVTTGGFTDWFEVEAGNTFTCALRGSSPVNGGALYCFGSADGSGGATPAAPQVGTAGDWIRLAAGSDHACGIRHDGSLWCWGRNIEGQCGLGPTGDFAAPTQVASAFTLPWSEISASSNSTCGINGGELYCWGDAWSANTPKKIGTATNWTTVAAAADHVCGTRGSSVLYCAGAGGSGQLGDGQFQTSATPVQAGLDNDWDYLVDGKLDGGGGWGCGISLAGKLRCWGYGADGELGSGGFDNLGVPTEIGTGGGPWLSVSAGETAGCAIGSAGLWCWGENDYGILGDGDGAQSLPVLVVDP